MTNEKKPPVVNQEFIAWLDTVPEAERAAHLNAAMDEAARVTRGLRADEMRRGYATSGSLSEVGQMYGMSRQRAQKIVTDSEVGTVPPPPSPRGATRRAKPSQKEER